MSSLPRDTTMDNLFQRNPHQDYITPQRDLRARFSSYYLSPSEATAKNAEKYWTRYTAVAKKTGCMCARAND